MQQIIKIVKIFKHINHNIVKVFKLILIQIVHNLYVYLILSVNYPDLFIEEYHIIKKHPKGMNKKIRQLSIN